MKKRVEYTYIYIDIDIDIAKIVISSSELRIMRVQTLANGILYVILGLWQGNLNSLLCT